LDSSADGAPLQTIYLVGTGYTALPEPRHLKHRLMPFRIFFQGAVHVKGTQ